METSERALRKRIVWRGERFPVGGSSGPPGLPLIVEEGRVVVDQILSKRIASRRRPQLKAANALVIQLTPCCLSCWQKPGFRPVLPTIGFEPMILAV